MHLICERLSVVVSPVRSGLFCSLRDYQRDNAGKSRRLDKALVPCMG